jgi:ABC-type glycerol-3-phosphate transport system permease component
MARPRPARFAMHLLLAVLVLLSLGPFLFMLVTSLKSNDQFLHSYFSLGIPPQWGNYAEAWGQVRGYLVNSISITAVSVAGGLALAALAAYAFSRYRFTGSGVLFVLVVAVMLVPGVLTLIPIFVILRDLSLIGTHRALYAVYITESLALGILVLRSFFASVPEELLEAASLDGASEIRIAARVVAPLAAPALLTVAIMDALAAWNEYLWPLIVLPDVKRWTIVQGLVAFRDRYAGMSAWGPLFAGFVIASAPLLVLFFASTRRFVSAITSGAMKA